MSSVSFIGSVPAIKRFLSCCSIFTLTSANPLMLYCMLPFYEVIVKTSSTNYKVYLKNRANRNLLREIA